MTAAAGIEIRPARVGEGTRLAELDQRTWSPLVTPQVQALAGRRYAGGGFDPGSLLVAERHGELAGYIEVSPPTPLASNAHVLEVRGLAVLPEHRGAGLGRRLLEAALELARARGARRMTLRVLGPNVVARRLYEAVGFEVEGVLRGEFRLEGEYVDDVLMAYSLASGPSASDPSASASPASDSSPSSST